LHSALATPSQLAAAQREDVCTLDYQPWREDVVVSLTTVPERLGTLRAVLRGLLTQSVRGVPIELHIAAVVRSSGDRWGGIPDWLDALHAVHVVMHSEDPGPALKFLPALLAGADRVVVVCDDDVLYPADLVGRLMLADARWGGQAAICFRGWRIERGLSWERSVLSLPDLHGDKPVGIVTGHGGYAVRARHVDLSELADTGRAPQACSMMDDVWISGHLSRRGTPKRLIYGETRFKIPIAPALGGDREARNDQALRWFAADWRAEDLEDHGPQSA
jgi:hypothetical protein